MDRFSVVLLDNSTRERIVSMGDENSVRRADSQSALRAFASFFLCGLASLREIYLQNSRSKKELSLSKKEFAFLYASR